MARTWGLFVRVREKRPPAPSWHPAEHPLWKFDIPGIDLSTYKGGGWVPHSCEPGVLVQYRKD